jgi:hypothetical protein
MPTLGRVQWTGDDAPWEAICALHADSELVAFRESDGTVSVETRTGGGWPLRSETGSSDASLASTSTRSDRRVKGRTGSCRSLA